MRLLTRSVIIEPWISVWICVSLCGIQNTTACIPKMLPFANFILNIQWKRERKTHTHIDWHKLNFNLPFVLPNKLKKKKKKTNTRHFLILSFECLLHRRRNRMQNNFKTTQNWWKKNKMVKILAHDSFVSKAWRVRREPKKKKTRRTIQIERNRKISHLLYAPNTFTVYCVTLRILPSYRFTFYI